MNDISDSLREIDAAERRVPRWRGKRAGKKRLTKRRVMLIIALIVGLVAGFFIYKALANAHKIFGNGNLLGLFQQKELQMDRYGRSNVLVLGTTDDDPNHPGGTLTDSIMVLSVDQKKKDAYMFSVPRDLYVKYGRSCNSGYAGKINEYFSCVDEGKSEEAEKRRMTGIRQFIGNIFGMDLQYVVHVNTTVIRDAVNAVGGVTVNVQSRDPRGVLDGSVDWMCRAKELTQQQRRERCPTGHYIHFKNGPNQMDGDKAMWFSRARGLAPPTYGLEQSNFDREKNQQLVLTALKSKATSAGTLTDFGKVSSLMDALGNNLRTNFDSAEIRTVMKLASEVKEGSIHRLSFVEENNTLMVTGSVAGAGSIVEPAAGLYNYTKIQAYIKSELYATPVSKEKAKVIVLNGSGKAGAAQTVADNLADEGMQIVQVGNAASRQTGSSVVYRLGSEQEKTATASKLSQLYGSVKQGPPPFTITTKADFVVVIGSTSR